MTKALLSLGARCGETAGERSPVGEPTPALKQQVQAQGAGLLQLFQEL